MSNPVDSLRRAVRGLAGWHPRYEDLLAYRDREVGWFARWRVAIHLRRCLVCQRKAALVEEEVGLFDRLDHVADSSQVFNLPEGLASLRQAIADWEGFNRSEDEDHEAVPSPEEIWQRELASELSVYLGTHAREVLRRLTDPDLERPRLLAEAESILRDFFGPRVAAAVADRILRVQALRERGAAGSFAT